MPYIADVIGELRRANLDAALRIVAIEATVRHIESMVMDLRRALAGELYEVSRETEETDGPTPSEQETLPGF